MFHRWIIFYASQIVAVAARKLENAKEFCEKISALRAYGSYQELAKDPDVGEYGWGWGVWDETFSIYITI